jgi:hypothetical protein
MLEDEESMIVLRVGSDSDGMVWWWPATVNLAPVEESRAEAVVRERVRGGGKVGKHFSTASMREEVSTSPHGAVVKPVGDGKRRWPQWEGVLMFLLQLHKRTKLST